MPCVVAEEDKKVLDACEKWLQQAEALVIEADAKIEGIMHQDAGNLLAEEWVTFVHKYSMQIKDIEQVISWLLGSCPVPPLFMANNICPMEAFPLQYICNSH